MSEIYFGKIGKANGWGLTSETRIVVYIADASNVGFLPAQSIAHAESLVKSDEDIIYVWDGGMWNEAHFTVVEKRAAEPVKTVKGFSPR